MSTTPLIRPSKQEIRLPLTPANKEGQWTTNLTLLFRCVGDLQSKEYSLTYFDETSECRRAHGEPALPGPWAVATRLFIETENPVYKRLMEDDVLLIDYTRFTVTAKDGLLHLEPAR